VTEGSGKSGEISMLPEGANSGHPERSGIHEKVLGALAGPTRCETRSVIALTC
jgi:hypothetical protein